MAIAEITQLGEKTHCEKGGGANEKQDASFRTDFRRAACWVSTGNLRGRRRRVLAKVIKWVMPAGLPARSKRI